MKYYIPFVPFSSDVPELHSTQPAVRHEMCAILI